MHAALAWLCIATGSVVFALILYSVAAYRGPRGKAMAHYRPRLFMELLWAAIPIVIVVSAAMPTLRQLMAPETEVIVTAQE
jgi:cytochrome c oxidase subunit II